MVCTVAVIVNPTQEELDASVYSYTLHLWVQLQSIPSESELWRAYFDGQIDE